MAVSFSSGVQSFVTKFTPEQIKCSERELENIETVYLHVKENEIDKNNVEAIGNITVGLQKTEHCITEFWDVEQCFTYIHEKSNTKIRLLLSNNLDEKKISSLKGYSHVVSVYQYGSPSPCIKGEYVPVDAQSSNPLNIQPLNSRHGVLNYDILSSTMSSASDEVIMQDFITDSRLFIQHQLLIEILLRLPISEESKKDFIDWCLEKYSANPADKEAIDQFASTFEPGQAVKYYTTSSFVHRILSRTFADNDIRSVFKIRYFICHLYKELKKLHEELFEILDPEIRVYRGKKMPLNKFHEFRASIDKLVITNCFVSTSLNKKVALFFSGEQEVGGDDVAVIFRMIIDKDANKSKPFAFIGKESTIEDEDEVILVPGIIFQNREIKKIRENLFEVLLSYTITEERVGEEIIRSKANYLERAQNINSIDDFTSLITDAFNSLNEQEIPQPSESQDLEQNNQPTEPLLAPMAQQQTTHQENDIAEHPSLERISQAPSKRLWAEINRLRTSSICNGTSAIFIIDRTSFVEGIELTPSNFIIGRIFPRSNIYNQKTYQIEISFPPAYPFQPPIVRFLTPIYHPNVDEHGRVCLDILTRGGAWSMSFTVIDVIEAVVKSIDNPEIEVAVRVEAAREYIENRAEFNRKALDMANTHRLPRN